MEDGTMQQPHGSSAVLTLSPSDETASTVPGGLAYVADIAGRLAPPFARSESRQRAMVSVRGRLSSVERKHSGQLAEVSGEATPYGFQYVLGRADWEADGVRDALRHSLVQHLGSLEAVLVVDETGVPKQGRHSAGVARQDSGTLGKMDHGQGGVLLGYASPLGHTLLDRELYVPQEWTNVRARCRKAGIPEARRFATKPQLAQQMLARAFAAGVPARWVTGDSVYGAARRLRRWLEARPQAYGWAVSSQEYEWVDGRQRQVKTILTALPEAGWTRVSAGDGAKGPRWGDWYWRPLAAPLEPGWRRWRLVRRSLSTPTELTADIVFARQETPWAEVVRVAGTRWTIESGFDAAKSEVGLEHYDVRSWTGWSRQMPLAMWALALLTVMRAGALAVEAFKKSVSSSQGMSPLAAFKASRGLPSR